MQSVLLKAAQTKYKQLKIAYISVMIHVQSLLSSVELSEKKDTGRH